MSFKIQTQGNKYLDVGLNIYHNPYVEAQASSREIAVGDKVKWADLDTVTGHNNFSFTTFTDSYDMIIPDDGFTYYFIAELNHHRLESVQLESYAFCFQEGSTELGFKGYHMGPLNHMIGEYTGDPHNNDSDDAARICVKGPKTINLVIKEVNGYAPDNVGVTVNSQYRAFSVEARMLVWRI